MEILDHMMNRSLDENLRDLVDVDSSNNNHRLLLIRHNSLMEDFFKGVRTKEAFDIEKTKIWDGMFYFVQRLNADKQQRLSVKLGLSGTTTNGKMSILYIASSPANVK